MPDTGTGTAEPPEVTDGLAASCLELECPGCNTDDPSDYRNGCEDPWHAEALALTGEVPDVS